MAKYVYPAIFTQEDAGISVLFPDLPSCYTSGEDLADALEMAEDVLCLTLYNLEESNARIPSPSNVETVHANLQKNEFVSLICCDTIEYRRFYDNRAVKKTLSIPSWLNDMAERAGINFSGTLQEALKQQLHIG